MNLVMKIVNNKFANTFMSKYHYSKTCPKSTICFGFYDIDNKLNCMIVYGNTIGINTSHSLFEGSNESNVLELLRLFSFDWCPRNTESYCISKSIKYIKSFMKNIKILISYADNSVGHIGYIYQASNWKYIGIGSNEKEILIDGIKSHRRSLCAKHGTSSIDVLKDIYKDRIVISENRSVKYKYVYVLDKNIIPLFEIFDYPKSNKDIINTSTGAKVFDYFDEQEELF